MLRIGVELYELRPEPGPVRKWLFGAGSTAGLHTKAIVFDRKDVFVGSFNLDARSALIRPEAGLYVQSSELAAQRFEAGLIRRLPVADQLLASQGSCGRSATVLRAAARHDRYVTIQGCAMGSAFAACPPPQATATPLRTWRKSPAASAASTPKTG